jgi:hypothetical protein
MPSSRAIRDAFAAFGAGTDVGNAARRVFTQRGVDGAAGHVLHQALAGARCQRAVGHQRGDDLGHF